MENNRNIHSEQSINIKRIIELINKLINEEASEEEMREAIIKELEVKKFESQTEGHW